jgi:hypothetical protein
MRELVFDFFCGRGGWAQGFVDAGYRVVGFDVEDFGDIYPGEFVQVDLRSVRGADLLARYGRPRVVTASPPCQFYSKLVLPSSWHDRWLADDGGKLWAEAVRLIEETGPEYWVIENVRGAEKVHGPARKKVGSRYLWGEFPIVAPVPVYGKWRMPPSPERTALRSMIPLPLSRAMAQACRLKGSPSQGASSEEP